MAVNWCVCVLSAELCGPCRVTTVPRWSDQVRERDVLAGRRLRVAAGLRAAGSSDRSNRVRRDGDLLQRPCALLPPVVRSYSGCSGSALLLLLLLLPPPPPPRPAAAHPLPPVAEHSRARLLPPHRGTKEMSMQVDQDRVASSLWCRSIRLNRGEWAAGHRVFGEEFYNKALETGPRGHSSYVSGRATSRLNRVLLVPSGPMGSRSSIVDCRLLIVMGSIVNQQSIPIVVDCLQPSFAHGIEVPPPPPPSLP